MSEHIPRHAHPLRWLLILPALVVVALVLNGLDPDAGKARLYFPDRSGSRLGSEIRRLNLVGSVEERAALVLEELMMGPFDRNLKPLFSAEARLGTVMHRSGTLYVDIVISSPEDFGNSFAIASSAIEKSIFASIPSAGALNLSINGQPVRR